MPCRFCLILMLATLPAVAGDSVPDWRRVSYEALDLDVDTDIRDAFLFDREQSLRPNTILLFETGRIIGHWLNAQQRTTLTVTYLRPSAVGNTRARAGAMLQLVTAGVEQTLPVAHASFVIFGLDLDNDGLDELVLQTYEEDVFGRRHRLRIYRITGRGFQLLTNQPISGFVLDKRAAPRELPCAYFIKYFFANVDTDPQIELVTVLQHSKHSDLSDGDHYFVDSFLFPKKQYDYDHESRQFELANVVFALFEAYETE